MSTNDENRGQNWKESEIITLINIWADESIQEEFEKSRRNAGIFEKIAKRMREAGYERSLDQCRSKLKKLKKQYFETRKDNTKSGASRNNSFPFYDEMDKVLGRRPSTEPSTLIDTSASCENSDDEDTADSDDQGDRNTDDQVDRHTPVQETPKPVGDPDLPKITLKRKQPYTPTTRKPTKSSKLESVMDKTITSFLEYQKEAEERYEEREERRCQVEREAAEKEREREREHELKLFAMLSGVSSPQPSPQLQRDANVRPQSSTGEQQSPFNISAYEPYSYYNL